MKTHPCLLSSHQFKREIEIALGMMDWVPCFTTPSLFVVDDELDVDYDYSDSVSVLNPNL